MSTKKHKYLTKKQVAATIVVAGMIGIGIYYAATNEWASANVEINNEKATTTPDRMSEAERIAGRVKETKWEVVDRIQECESAGYTEDDAPIVHDSNNALSIGVLQWQIKSVQHYAEKWYGEKLTRKESVLLALDAERARELAYRTIWDETGGVWNWRNCAEKTGVAGTIETIRTIEAE